MSEERCETCRFWKVGIDGLNDRYDSPGECRRFPPTLNQVAVYFDAKDNEDPGMEAVEVAGMEYNWAFAQTISGRWCGEYQSATTDT